jgi:hypothetical protein
MVVTVSEMKNNNAYPARVSAAGATTGLSHGRLKLTIAKKYSYKESL